MFGNKKKASDREELLPGFGEAFREGKWKDERLETGAGGAE